MNWRRFMKASRLINLFVARKASGGMPTPPRAYGKGSAREWILFEKSSRMTLLQARVTQILARWRHNDLPSPEIARWMKG